MLVLYSHKNVLFFSLSLLDINCGLYIVQLLLFVTRAIVPPRQSMLMTSGLVKSEKILLLLPDVSDFFICYVLMCIFLLHIYLSLT